MSLPSGNTLDSYLNPEWSELDRISELLKPFLQIGSNHYNAVYMVTTELVENAIKYGYFPDSSSKIHLHVKKKKDRILMEVKNPVKDSDLVHLKRLDSKIQWIRGFQNPFEAYVERIKELSTKTLEEGESGLGLVRIAYEGQSILDFYLSENNILAVSAVYEFVGE